AYCCEASSVSGRAKCSSSAILSCMEPRSETLLHVARNLEVVQLRDLLALAAEKGLAADLAHAEVGLQHFEGVTETEGDVSTHRLGGFVDRAVAENLQQILMPPPGAFRGWLLRDAEPHRRQHVGLVDGRGQGRTTRALGDAPVQLLVPDHELPPFRRLP